MKRHQELGIVLSKLKSTLDTKIRTASKSKKRPMQTSERERLAAICSLSIIISSL